MILRQVPKLRKPHTIPLLNSDCKSIFSTKPPHSLIGINITASATATANINDHRSLWTTPTMPSRPRGQPSTSVDDARVLLRDSRRILALCGAGLSASSGLPTFRGAGGLWRNHDPTRLATRDAFRRDPALVWLFYAWRRHLALSVEPNGGHRALAELAEKKNGFLCLTQNVDCEFCVEQTCFL